MINKLLVEGRQLTKCKSLSNKVDAGGGAVFVWLKGTVNNIKDTIFVENSALKSGCALMVENN